MSNSFGQLVVVQFAKSSTSKGMKVYEGNNP